MASFPTAKVHRISRRKLGRGQAVQRPAVTSTVTAALGVVTVAFSVPCVVTGLIPLSVATITDVPVQAQVNATTWHLTYGESVVGKAWTLQGGGPNVVSNQGGTLASASGTF